MKTDAIQRALSILRIPLPVQRRSEKTMFRILDAACECVADVGYSQTSTQEIARRAGVSHGGLFKRFPSKVVLLAAMVVHIQHRAITDAALEITDALLQRSIIERVSFFVQKYWRFTQTVEYRALDFIWTEARTNKELETSLSLISKVVEIGGELRLVFPEIACGKRLRFLTDVVYATCENYNTERLLQHDAEVEASIEMLTTMVAREVSLLGAVNS